MALIFELNGKIVEIEQGDFTLDFVADDGGFNAIPISDESVTVYNRDFDESDINGIDVLNKWFAENGLAPIPCKLTHTDPNIGVLKQGYADTRKNEYTKCTADLYIISEFSDFTDRAEILNLRKLIETGTITTSDYQKVGYVLEMETRELLSFLFSMVINLLALLSLINQIKAESTRVTTPPNPWILIFMYAELIISITIQTKMVIDFLKSKPKKLSYYCIPYKTLIEKACNYLGYSFESSILDNPELKNMVLLGDTEHKGVSKNKTPKNNPIPDMNLMDLIISVGKKFKTKLLVRDSVVSLEEEKTYYENPSDFVIPRMQDDDNNPLTATHNLGEIPLSYTVEFATDSSDRNTTKENFGNKVTAHYLLEQSLQSRENDFFAPPVINQIQFSRATRKNNFNDTEKVYNGIMKGLSLPLRLLGFNTNDLLIQDDVKKCFKLETHGINNTKVIITDGNGFVSTTNSEILDAENLYNKYHKQYTLAGGQGGYAFWTNYEGSLKTGLCQGDAPNFLLSELNRTLVARTKEGATAVITMHQYQESTNSHDFRYRVKGFQNIFGHRFNDIKTPVVTEVLTVERE